MIIAIATENGEVAQHFGHCEKFTIYDVENGNVLNSKEVACPEHDCESLPRFLGENGVQLVIAGGIGMRPAMHFSTKGIQVIPGVRGSIKDAINAFVRGSLTGGANPCSSEHHEGGKCRHD